MRVMREGGFHPPLILGKKHGLLAHRKLSVQAQSQSARRQVIANYGTLITTLTTDEKRSQECILLG
jgi:hypothetical protein